MHDYGLSLADGDVVVGPVLEAADGGVESLAS